MMMMMIMMLKNNINHIISFKQHPFQDPPWLGTFPDDESPEDYINYCWNRCSISGAMKRSREFNLQDLHGIPRELALLGGAAVVFQFSQGGNGIFQDPSW